LNTQLEQDASASENNKEASDGAAKNEKSRVENEIKGEDAAPR